MTDDRRFDALESGLRLPGLAAQLARALAAAADPQRAEHLAADVLAASAGHLGDAWAARPETVARVLAALCGAAPFLAPFLIREPTWLARLSGDALDTPRSAAEYAARVATALDGVADADVPAALRRCKYYELARLTVRDLFADSDEPSATEAVVGELAHLADALLAAALRCAMDRVAGRHGAPRWPGADGGTVAPRFCVLGMGKLGGEELNYSSDVDLVYVLEPLRLADDAGGLSPDEYFGRVAQEFGRLVSSATRDGFLYRIDLDLRPEGQAGPLVVPSPALADYYDTWALTWEKAAFMKARPVAGDLDFGWQVIRAVDPIIYRSTMDYAGVAAIKTMKERIERAEERSGAAFNVKVGSGGIRDVEFVAQALQLLHGGRIPQVRGRSTQRALAALAQVGVLPAAQSAELLAAYAFLRRTESRLQMEGERQTHRLPTDPGACLRLARAMGFLAAPTVELPVAVSLSQGADEAVAAFSAALEAERQRIRAIFAALFADDGSQRLLELFERNVPHLLAQPETRGQIEHLATRFARALEASPDPERAMNNLDRFIRGLGSRTFYYGLLVDRPELVDRLATLFAASEYLSGYLAAHPRLIEPIFDDPSVLVPARPALHDALQALRRELGATVEDSEAALEALRLFQNRELVNIGLLDLTDKITPADAEAGLTDLAEVCVDAGLAIARDELARRGPPPAAVAQGEFLVVGMGKLGSRELTYGSDLDVIFLYAIPDTGDEAQLEAQEYYVRLAQKLIWALQTRTRGGLCYQIDARLRPSGNQGMLVTALDRLAHYHAASAQVWERQALLRARPAAGSARLAAAFVDLRLAILRRPLPADVGAEIHRVRQRMEAELAHETSQRRDFKTGRGGLLDVETVVQLLQLTHGGAHPALLDVDRTATHLDRLAALGLLDAADAAVLRRGWDFLQRLSSRLRIVENRSISDLDEERGDLEGLARRLGYTSPQRAGGARRALLDDYRRHTADIRAVYATVLGFA